MNQLVAVLQCCAFVSFFFATLFITRTKSNIYNRVTTFIIASFLVLLSVISFFNFMRSIGVTGFIEQYEGYIEILIFPLALFSLYSMRNDLANQKIRKSQAEEQLKATLLDAVSDAIFLHDFNGQMKYINRSALQQLGYQKADVLSLTLHKILSAHAQTEVQELIERIRQENFYRFESTLRTADGLEIPIDVNAQQIEYEGTTLILSVARDATERKRVEEERTSINMRLQQAQKMESLGTLAGGIAHDFNNILVPILGYSDLLVESFQTGSKEYESANKILQAAERARDIVKQILSFSRAKRESESAHPVFVHHVLREVLELVKEVLPRSAVLETNIRSCSPVISTASQIHRICLNLITNAYQALEEHPGTVKVTLTEIEPPKGAQDIHSHWVELRISDTGSGMTKEQQLRIFEPYFTTKQEGIGTGLGLSVVNGIIREIGGKIEVESEREKGTTFIVMLPGAHEQKLGVEEPTLQYNMGSGKLMVVDDEEVVGVYLKEILENAGYHVTLFNESSAALTAFQRTPYEWQLIISDFTMPQLTGDKLAEAIRSIDSRVGFILCSGYSGQLDEATYKRLSIDGFVLKPLRPKELLTKVQKVLIQKGYLN